MSSSSDGYAGLSALAIINLAIWIPIIVMVSAYYSCSTKYRGCRNTMTGECCFKCKGNSDDSMDESVLMSIIETGSDDPDFDPNIYSISNSIGFDSVEELQIWYNNFEQRRTMQSISRNGQRRFNSRIATPPPSYASLYSHNDDLPFYDDLPNLV